MKLCYHVSSANKVNSEMIDTSRMSLRYKSNNLRQKIETCETPHRIFSRLDLVPLICTNCFQCDK